MAGNLAGIFGDEGQAVAAASYSGGGNVLPPGTHKMVIVDAEMRENKNKNGTLVVVVFEAEAGQKLTEYLNIANSNEIAQRIGRSALAKISECVGIKEINNTDQLVGLSLVIRVRQFEEEYKGKMIKKNEITGYFPADYKTSVEPAPPAAKESDKKLSWQ